MLSANPLCNPMCRVCHYKNLDYPAQLERKQKWASSQLHRWSDALQPIRPAPESEQLAYRSKSWLRTHVQDGAVSFGMYRAVNVQGKWEKEFISWDTCPLHSQAIQQMIQRLKVELAKESREFLEQSLVGIWVGTPHLVVVTRTPAAEVIRRLDWSRILVPPFSSVWSHCNVQVGRHVFGYLPIESIFKPSVESSEERAHPILAFRQIAQSLLVEARSLAVESLLRPQPKMVVDLYCGTGELSLLLPSQVGWLGIEFSKEAVKYANTLRPASDALHAAYVGGVEQRLSDPKVLSKIEGAYSLYLNPPRSGLTEEAREKVIALMREKRPVALTYLSCSASSLARDLEAFEREGYRVKLLQPYDFFPQTEHFETLAILV